MLIKCPECEKEVSEFAEMCPDCGYPIQKYLPKIQAEFESEVQKLKDKVKSVEFLCDSPRAKVCLKCGTLHSERGLQNCSCQSVIGQKYPLIEVDYPEEEAGGDSELLYIHESCVIPMNIGDVDSEEYQTAEKNLYERIRRYNSYYTYTTKMIRPQPPKRTKLDPSAVQEKPTSTPAPKPVTPVFTPTPVNVPKCPICGSTSLTKISTMKKAAKIATFGIFGMGDNGKTWKCNSCGSKF